MKKINLQKTTKNIKRIDKQLKKLHNTDVHFVLHLDWK